MDMLDFARYFAGLVLVLGLLAGFAYLLRRGMMQGLFPGMPGSQSHRRMSVKESLLLDPRRRVLIIKVDDTEHIVLLGASGEQILDTKPALPDFVPDMPQDEVVS